MFSWAGWLAWLIALTGCESIPSAPKHEFRAVWVVTSFNIDWPSKSGLSPEVQQKEFLDLLDYQQSLGTNAVIVQVRGSGDALYPSKLAPWSAYLTGTQGKNPEYDPLAFMIEACHERNMEFHAWLNPFRAISHVRFSSVDSQHMARQHPDWTFQYGETAYFDPGLPEVRTHITEVVSELVSSYDLDGVHFDDYFYPYRKGRLPIPDQQTFRTHANGEADLAAWRRNNLNIFVSDIAKTLRTQSPHVKFGISPMGIWRNQADDPRGSKSRVSQTAYDALHADVRTWLEKGWIDYVAPQLYWRMNHPQAGYAELLPWWEANSFGRHLYAGQAMYKFQPTGQKPARWKGADQLVQQMALNRTLPLVKGHVLYSAKALQNLPEDVQQTLKGSRAYPALIPPMSWKDSIPPLAPRNLALKQSGTHITLNWEQAQPAVDGDTARYFVVYRFRIGKAHDLSNPEHIVSIQRAMTFTDTLAQTSKDYTYLVTAFDRGHNESRTCAAAIWSAKAARPYARTTAARK